MPRYFFHSVSEQREHDLIGTELTDDAVARREAILFAATVIRDQPDLLEHGLECQVEVTNDAGDLTCVVSMTATSISDPDRSAYRKTGNVTAIREARWHFGGNDGML